jgi:trigger factor
MEQTANTMPAATLGQYKGLAFTRRVRPVSDKAVEADIGNLARVHAPFVPTDAPAARGMRVTLDFEGFLAGASIPDSRMEKVTVVLGTGQLMPAAEDAVYGHCAGETFRFDFTYPADFRVPELSGKTAQFEICLHTVERKQVPPVDDALAKSLGFADLDALRESLREKKRLSHEANADRIAGAALLGMAGANLTAELDNAILDQNADHDMNALRERLRRSKMTMELYCKAGQTTPDEVRAAFRRDAERKMRSILAVQAIAKAEQITVSNAEVDAEYVRLSKLHDTPEAEIRNVLSRDAVASAVTTQKVQRFLIDHANITSVVEKE